MTAVTLYHNPRCSKSRSALALLTERGAEVTVVEYLKTPPTVEDLTQIVSKLNVPLAALVRKKEAKEAGIDPESLSPAALIAALVASPAALERPLAVTTEAARLGRPPESVLELLG